MKTKVFPALLAAVAMLAACDSQVETTPQTVVADPAAQATEIAGDKAMMADAMQRSFQKGTFDDALALAIADSALASEVISVMRSNPRYAALFDVTPPSAEPQQATTASARTSTGRSSTSSAKQTPRSTSKDPLQQAEQTMQKANEKLDQAERVRQQMEEARRKTEGILRPR